MCFPSIFMGTKITITYHCSITANMLQIMMKCCSRFKIICCDMFKHAQKNVYNKA